MSGTRRLRSPRKRMLAFFVACLAALGLVAGGVAIAAPTATPGTSSGNGQAATGERVAFSVTDTGGALIVNGTARGLDRNSTYVSLVYPNDTCSVAEGTDDLTFDGTFQNHGERRQSLYAGYTGPAYNAVKGKVGSVSLRKVTTVTTTGTGTPPVFAAALTPIVCVDLVPNR